MSETVRTAYIARLQELEDAFLKNFGVVTGESQF
jgi:hypothetical protein